MSTIKYKDVRKFNYWNIWYSKRKLDSPYTGSSYKNKENKAERETKSIEVSRK
mgnify:CR=1 FL=1